ncbi:TonB-dependent receptor domain-containing protein, partial [Escherichia coli]|nr:TonB-dependent receptor [Escherichia coli]
GLRGEISTGRNGRISWNGSVFRTVNSNDILEIASGIPGRGYFQNAGRTRRQGVEINTSYRDGKWRLFANYSLIDATYRSPLTLNSPFNPFADEDG